MPPTWHLSRSYPIGLRTTWGSDALRHSSVREGSCLLPGRAGSVNHRHRTRHPSVDLAEVIEGSGGCERPLEGPGGLHARIGPTREGHAVSKQACPCPGDGAVDL